MIWVDRIQAGSFEDTDRMFVPPGELRSACDGRKDRRNTGRSRQ